MTDNQMMHQGKTIDQWFKDFKGEFSKDQLEKMAKGGADLQKILMMGLDETDVSEGFVELPLDGDEGLDETDAEVEAAALSESIKPNYTVHVKVMDMSTAFSVNADDELDAENKVRDQIKKLTGSNPKVEIEKIDSMKTLNESFDDDIVTVTDFAKALKRSMAKDNDKIMFRTLKDKAALMVYQINGGKGGTVVVDLVPALANESKNWEDEVSEEEEK